jgi:hypothetical protein
MSNSEETAWLAGLLEGEGSFFMISSRVGGKVYRYPCVAVAMTDRDVIERAASLMGTVVRFAQNTRGNKPYWRAHRTGAPAVEIMQRIRSLMGKRRSGRIDGLIAEWDAREPAAVRRARSCKLAAARRQRKQDGTFIAAYAAPSVLADFIRNS